MATEGERRILGFLVIMALLGASVRARGVERLERAALGGASVPPATGAARALAAQRAAIESARSRPRSGNARAARTGTIAETEKVSMAPPGTRGRIGSVGRSAPMFPIDVNTATERELEALPRVGPAIARRIVERRERAGPYRSLDDLRQVRGIGPATLRLLDSLVTFSPRHSPSHSEKQPPASHRPLHISVANSRFYGCISNTTDGPRA